MIPPVCQTGFRQAMGMPSVGADIIRPAVQSAGTERFFGEKGTISPFALVLPILEDP